MMRRDGKSVFVGFPGRLMSTARSAVSMGPEYAREIVNMYAAADGAGTKRNGVAKVGGALPGGAGALGVFSYLKAGVGLQLLAVADDGCVYLQDGAGWQQVWSGLNPLGVPRGAVFAGRLVLVNGFDPMLAWDGDAWQVVEEKITDLADGLTYVGATQFRIDSLAELYPVGSEVRATVGGVNVVANVSAVSVAGMTVTVTLDAAVLGANLSAVAFTRRPPVMAYVYAAHDRLWGFGKGPLRGSVVDSDVDRARVFYTDGVNDVTRWHDSEGVVGSINLADKSQGGDSLMAMAVKDGVTVFLLRNSVQLWSGSTPGAEGDFGWQKTIPAGTVHGGLVVELPNDVAFLSRNGVRTLSRALQTEQLDVSDVGGEIDPTLAEQLKLLLADDEAYRKAGSVVCEAQNWFGVKLFDKLLVFQVGGANRGWVVFDGVMAAAQAFHAAPDGRVYLAVGGQLYVYDEARWDDDGTPLMTRWWTPWLRLAGNGKRWANRYMEVVTAHGVPMALTLRRYRNLDDGDGWVMALEGGASADYWDDAVWDVGLFDNANPPPAVVRDHFVCDEMALALESHTTEGPLTVLGVKVHGVPEK
ncbi:MAG: hypothetical protein H6922_06145 [Pseudomonadaceae bacterium]|nr:hypothetical protein [Pseudomonadaceae bacterium]